VYECTQDEPADSRWESGGRRFQPQRGRPRGRGHSASVDARPSERRRHPLAVPFTQLHEVGVLLREEISDHELSGRVPDSDRRRRGLPAPHLGARTHDERVGYMHVIRKHRGSWVANALHKRETPNRWGRAIPHSSRTRQKGKRPERPPSEKVYPQVVPPGFPFGPSWEYHTILAQVPRTRK
jgi:hypothetical protein